jgi:MFS transporter, SP family, arabinose:H+ symporter
MNAAISWAFPIIAARSKSIPFAFFSAMMLLQFFVVWFIYPETKGVTLEDMQERLAIS